MKKLQVQRFMMVEMVMAIALLLILSGAFYAVWGMMRKMDQTFTAERQSIMVMDNTLERLENMGVYPPEVIQAVFMDEFGKSGIPVQLRITPRCEERDGKVLLSLRKPNGKDLIEVTLNAKK